MNGKTEDTPEAPKVHDEVHEHDQSFVAKRKICLPIDSSKSSHFTIDYVLKHIANKQDQVILIHCRKTSAFDFANTVPYGFIPYGALLPSGDMQRIENAHREKSHEILKTEAMKFKSAGIHVRAISIVGDPREEIEHKINELGVDFVVLGSRGLGAIKRVTMGSVSTYMVNHLKVPVMVVPFE